jgi:hypothetical protein
MNRCNLVSSSAVAVMGFALLPSGVIAQQGTLKQQLVGTWMLVSCEAPAGTTQQPFCANPSGSQSFDANGRYTQVIAARGRPKATASPDGLLNRADIKPEEYKAVAQGVVAQFGTWSVNEADKTLTRKTEGALFPNAEGTETKFSVNLSGDELKFGTPNNPAAGGTVWRRAK